MAKTAGSLAERLESADVLALGVLTQVTPRDRGKSSNATLHVVAGLKGVEAGTDLAVQVYTSGAADGAAAVWMLKHLDRGRLAETYPWLRLSPEVWPRLPDPLRQPVYRAVGHAVGQPVAGVRLHLFRVPTIDPRRITVWLGIENTTDVTLNVPYSVERDALGFSLALPGGKSAHLPLLRDDDLRALEGGKAPRTEIAAHYLLLVRRPGGQPGGDTQLHLATAAQPGYCRIRARLTLPDAGPAWHGTAEVLATTSITE